VPKPIISRPRQTAKVGIAGRIDAVLLDRLLDLEPLGQAAQHPLALRAGARARAPQFDHGRLLGPDPDPLPVKRLVTS
jgi:hypothetical protein